MFKFRNPTKQDCCAHSQQLHHKSIQALVADNGLTLFFFGPPFMVYKICAVFQFKKDVRISIALHYASTTAALAVQRQLPQTMNGDQI